MLELNNLYCGYDGIDVVKGVSFKVEPGQNLSIVGPNGCGKTTLLRAIANLIEYKGNVKIDGKEVIVGFSIIGKILIFDLLLFKQI